MELIGSLIGLGVLAAAPRIPVLRSATKVVVKTGLAVTDATVTFATFVTEEVGDLVAHVREDRTEEAAPEVELADETAGDVTQVPPWLDNTDFLQIDGIGPKVSAILKAAGIDTIMQMAATPAERLQEILDAAGPRFGAIDSSTWPGQAQALLAGEQV